MTLLWYH